MTIRSVAPDKQKAQSLLASAESFIRSIEPIKDSAEGPFLINIEYDILHSICGAILAAIGEKIIGKDHHKILITRICEKYQLSQTQTSLLDKVRRIRNDINYYGQQDNEVIEDFYQRNKKNLWKIREILLKVLIAKVRT
jgi:hypothetical protein